MDIQLHKAVIVLADIGGYTKFIKFHDVALVHAEKIITDLLESVIEAAEYPLTLNKLEGDAALFYALADKDPEGVVRSAISQVSGFFGAFAAKKAALTDRTVCTCTACQSIGDLRIKAIVHFGETALKQVRQFQELAGQSVIVAHRLLKNSVEKDQYILVTAAADRLAGGLLSGGTRMVEHCEGIGNVDTVAYDPPAAPLPERHRASRLEKGIQLMKLMAYQWGKRFGVIRSRAFPKLAGL